jgi:hypothetical protein
VRHSRSGAAGETVTVRTGDGLVRVEAYIAGTVIARLGPRRPSLPDPGSPRRYRDGRCNYGRPDGHAAPADRASHPVGNSVTELPAWLATQRWVPSTAIAHGLLKP